MQALGIPDLLRAGAVCSSWYAACSAVRRVRFPITDAAPCLLYSARGGGGGDDDTGAATLYSASSGASFSVHLPDPPLRRRALVGSAHGWLATADEASYLHLVNPLTGAQLALPPVTALYHIESFLDEQGGSLMYGVQESEDLVDPDDPVRYPAEKLRLFLYYKVVMSCSPSKGRDCIVLLLHRPDGEISFARIGDGQWTQITDQTLKWVGGYRDALYDKKDGLFYVLSFDGSMLTLDLSDPSSPVAKDILPRAIPWNDPIKDIMLTPSGDLLQVWRLKEIKRSATPIEVPVGVAHEVDDPYKVSRIMEFFLYKVDIDKQDLVKLSSIGEHALFLGYNSAVCLHTKDFQELNPDSAYVTDGFDEEMCANKHNFREIGIWDFKTESLHGLGEVQSRNPWLNWPAPIWITPSLH
ncbi:unnamed protein product [Urochloa decumbens]|uniref:KIB1-4 beta-propeller domain-containing protein n=1 Tax=Urochloa decumbens TaxID=240449 RepID=A0ABC9B2W3_9POAL